MVQPVAWPLYRLNYPVPCYFHRPGLANLWHAAFTTVPISFIPLPDQRLYIVTNTFIYTHIWLSWDCIWISVATNCSETLLHSSREMRNIDQVFLIGALPWQWMGGYVTLDTRFYKLIFKEEVTGAPVTSHIDFIMAFVINIVVILPINYVIYNMDY